MADTTTLTATRLKAAAESLGLTTEQAKEQFTDQQLVDMARSALEFKNRPGDPTPPVPSALDQITFGRGLVEGTNQVGGISLDAIPANVVRGPGEELAKRAGLDLNAGNVTLEQLIDAGLTPQMFGDQFRRALEQAGIVNFDVFAPENLSQLREGFFSGAKQIREELEQRALDTFGRTPEEFGIARDRALQDITFDAFRTDDPFVQAERDALNQEIRSAFAARGLGDSGASAVLESTEGIRLLDRLGRERRQEGLSTLGFLDQLEASNLQLGLGQASAAESLSVGGLGQLGLGFADQAFQRTLGGNLLFEQLNQAFEAQQIAKQSTGDIFRQNFNANIGASTGNFLGGGGLGSASVTSADGTQKGGSGLGGILSLLIG